jgi:hypothetical protein
VNEYQEAYIEEDRLARENMRTFMRGGKYRPSRRREFTAKYSWAIPNDEAIAAIVACGPVVEIGAGSGYWAKLISDAGGDIIAFDESGKHGYDFDEQWFPVQFGSVEKAAEHSDRALMLCWPNYDSPFAMDCLQAYTGDTVIYIGEGGWGCTADDDFHAELEDSGKWELQEDDVDIPQWAGIHDNLWIYKRCDA